MLMLAAALLALATGLWLSAWWLLGVGALCYAQAVIKVGRRYGDFRSLDSEAFQRADSLVKIVALVNGVVCLAFYGLGLAFRWAFQ